MDCLGIYVLECLHVSAVTAVVPLLTVLLTLWLWFRSGAAAGGTGSREFIKWKTFSFAAA